ncbi:M15 family metallopeptidase [Mesorhizobium sp. M1A.F.Ca.ET.072.01.1.1]|nr:M15 family metallopeptidase [Mesorhizobium sp. M1A.F.Ca.ET.072.01.1.1]
MARRPARPAVVSEGRPRRPHLRGYVGELSSHSRGSTVDLAVAELDETTAAHRACGATDPGTLDFGTGFDCFDSASETAHRPLPLQATANRTMLLSAMRAAGFGNYAREWWHFTLADEPFPSSASIFR